MLSVISLPVFAAGINLNGDFSDWYDKPELYDEEGDEQPFKDLIRVKWFPDPSSSNLYLYCERVAGEDKKDNKGQDYDPYDDRYDPNYNESVDDDEIYNDVFKNFLNGNRRFKYWFLTADFSSDRGSRKAYILYHPPSRRVFVLLFDNGLHYLWSANGKWGDNKDSAKRIEFYVPLRELVSSVEGGYEVDLYFECGNDTVPDTGVITISTISTFPRFTAGAAAILAVTGFAALKLRKTKLAERVG